VATISIDVSIVIPLYNKELYIQRVLDCIESQTLTNWECIIVDDGSTDNSPKIVKEFLSTRANKWHYIYQENQGQAAARNTGIDHSQGKYLAFLDADDFWPNYKLESQFVALESNPKQVAVLSPFVIFNTNSKIPRLVTHKTTQKMLLGWITMRGFGGGIESVGLIRRSALEKDLRFNPLLSTSSGLDFTLRLSERGDIGFVEKIGLLYQINEGQWHTNTHELIRNTAVIRSAYSKYPASSLDEWHDAYIYWARRKSEGPRRFVFALLGSFLHPKRHWRLGMIWSLITRNAKAKFLGIAHRKEIESLLLNKT
jgi:glycosyltransferase involved in cell wall biosynthesis